MAKPKYVIAMELTLAGWSPAEVAAELGITVGNVFGKLSYGRSAQGLDPENKTRRYARRETPATPLPTVATSPQRCPDPPEAVRPVAAKPFRAVEPLFTQQSGTANLVRIWDCRAQGWWAVDGGRTRDTAVAAAMPLDEAERRVRALPPSHHAQIVPVR